MLGNLLNNFKSRKKHQTVIAADTILPCDSEWQSGDIILDRYRVDDVFSGAMGRVFISEHLGWQVKMAIKVPKQAIIDDKEGMQRILTEANSWVKMGMHPNIATCYYVLNIKSTPYIFIEYVDGGDLSSWIKLGRCRDLRTSLSLAIQFCHGMEFTHSHGIIHRDIKPGNILVSKNALLKITDFGIIQTDKETDQDGTLPQGESETTIGFRGTPSYASPEQFRNSHEIDRRSDIFSFGVCLWLMLCGHRPFKNNAIPGQANPTPQDPKRSFPDVLADLLQKSVAYNPEDRQQTFAELRQALNESYLDLFRVPCPYMDLDTSTFQAENLNNRAVSFLELSKKDEGEKFLQKSLDVDDTLPEAIFNYTLFKWQNGTSPERLLKQLDASKKRQPDAKMLNSLTQAIKCDLFNDVWCDDSSDEESEITVDSKPTKSYYPEFLLCMPKYSLSIFQKSQVRNSAKSNIKALFREKQYEACSKLLFDLWQADHFKKDELFLKVYKKLQETGKSKGISAVIRLKTIRPNAAPSPEKMIYLTSNNHLLSLHKDGIITSRSLSAASKVTSQKYETGASTFAASGDGRFMATGHPNGSTSLVHCQTKKKLTILKGETTVTALSFSHNNSHLIVGYENGIIRNFSLKNGEEYMVNTQVSSPISAIIQFSKGDDYVTSNNMGTIMHWRTKEPEPIRIIKSHDHAVKTLAPSPNDLLFISGEDGPHLKIWDRQTGQCIKTIEPHEGLAASFMFLQDGKHFVSASDDDIIKVWDIATGKELFILDGRGNGITSIAQGPYPNIFITGCQDGSIIIWMIIYELEFS